MNSKAISRNHTKTLVYIAVMAALTAICAQLSVPYTIPFTMQTFAVFVAAGLLGGRKGTAAIGLYVLMGAVGFPVFQGFSGGFGAVMGPTGGYIIGFVVAAAVTGFLVDRFGKGILALSGAMLAGLIACYAFGTAWFVIVYTKMVAPIGFVSALSICVVPYLVPDAIKIALAVILVNRLKKWIHA